MLVSAAGGACESLGVVTTPSSITGEPALTVVARGVTLVEVAMVTDGPTGGVGCDAESVVRLAASAVDASGASLVLAVGSIGGCC